MPPTNHFLCRISLEKYRAPTPEVPWAPQSLNQPLHAFSVYTMSLCFNFAVIASDRAGAGQENEARCMGRASIGVSVAGILITVVVVSIIVGVTYSNIKAGATTPSDCYRYCKASYSGLVEYRRCNLCI